jgi:hypothetical protein
MPGDVQLCTAVPDMSIRCTRFDSFGPTSVNPGEAPALFQPSREGAASVPISTLDSEQADVKRSRPASEALAKLFMAVHSR